MTSQIRSHKEYLLPNCYIVEFLLWVLIRFNHKSVVANVFGHTVGRSCIGNQMHIDAITISILPLFVLFLYWPVISIIHFRHLLIPVFLN